MQMERQVRHHGPLRRQVRHGRWPARSVGDANKSLWRAISECAEFKGRGYSRSASGCSVCVMPRRSFPLTSPHGAAAAHPYAGGFFGGNSRMKAHETSAIWPLS